jgi:hypothetical protein
VTFHVWSAAIVPQLTTAVLLYVGWKRQKSWVPFVAPLLAPPAFFVLARAYWLSAARDVHELRGKPPCGAFGAAAVLSTGVGVLVHLIVALVLIAIWRLAMRGFFRRRLRARE